MTLKTKTNVFDASLQKIDDFISRTENQQLKAGTGQFSTLFRGSLFGQTQTNNVLNNLKDKKLDVLWLGSNPNVPESLESIISSSPDLSPDFYNQKNSPYFSQTNLQTGETGWAPKGHWKFYKEILNNTFQEDSILMANFVPWGSKDFNYLITQLSNTNPQLLKRLLVFSNELNRFIIQSLNPKLIVVPKSISENNKLNKICKIDIHTKNQIDLKYFKNINTINGKRKSFIFSVGYYHHNNQKTKILSCPHPSAINRLIHSEDRQKVQAAITNKLT